MIQVYKPDNTVYDKNGDMTLIPTTCESSSEINGAWELTMSHPIDDEGRWKYLSEEAVISAPTFQGDHQLFRVDKCVKTDSSVDVTAYPIFFDSADDCFLMDVRPTGKNGQEALDIMTAGSKYSGSSDITTGGTAYFVRRNLMDAINGENEPTFIQIWGGEILYDNHTVVINERIGSNKGLEIRYGKNMESVSSTVDMSNVVTRIVPVAYNGRTMSGNTPWVDSDNISKYAKIYTREVKFEDVKLAEDANEDDAENGIIVCQDQDALDAVLTQKCEDMYAAGADLPTVSIEVNMVDLQYTDQYKDFADLVSVGLGDDVACYNYKLGITTTARVIKLTWDCIRNRSAGMTLGDYEYNYFSELTSSLQAIQKVIGPGDTVIAERVSGVLNAINTQLRYQKNIAQKQDVRAILFEDTDPDSPTYGAMCLGTQGFQIADSRTQDESDWDWTTAFTAKGGYANVLVAGLISDKTGRSYWNLDTGDIVINGKIVSSSAEITGGSFNVQSNSQYNSVISLRAEQHGYEYRTNMQPIQLESMDDRQKYISWVSGALGLACGTYNGTIDNPGTITAKSSIVQGFIQCENLTQTSDARLKKEIKEIPEELAEKIVLSAKPKSFKFKDGDKTILGFIAQDVREILGEDYNLFIEESEKDGIKNMMSVSYLDFIAPIVKMIQVHDDEIKKIKEVLR